MVCLELLMTLYSVCMNAQNTDNVWEYLKRKETAWKNLTLCDRTHLLWMPSTSEGKQRKRFCAWISLGGRKELWSKRMGRSLTFYSQRTIKTTNWNITSRRTIENGNCPWILTGNFSKGEETFLFFFPLVPFPLWLAVNYLPPNLRKCCSHLLIKCQKKPLILKSYQCFRILVMW